MRILSSIQCYMGERFYITIQFFVSMKIFIVSWYSAQHLKEIFRYPNSPSDFRIALSSVNTFPKYLVWTSKRKTETKKGEMSVPCIEEWPAISLPIIIALGVQEIISLLDSGKVVKGRSGQLLIDLQNLFTHALLFVK